MGALVRRPGAAVPEEAALAKTVVLHMTPEMRAQWLAELSRLSVEQAVDLARSMLAKATTKGMP